MLHLQTVSCNVIIDEGLQDEKFIAERTEGYEKIKEIVKDYTPERVAEICHIDADELRKAAIMYAKADTRSDHLLPWCNRAFYRYGGRYVHVQYGDCW